MSLWSRKIRAPDGVEVTLMLPVRDGPGSSQPKRRSAAATATHEAKAFRMRIISPSVNTYRIIESGKE